VSHLGSRIAVLVGLIAAIAAIQRVFANASGSERRVEAALATLTPKAFNFVAMEYCYGMLNRTYLVFVTANTVIGIRVRGLMSAPMWITERCYNPYFYPRPRAVEKYNRMNLEAPALLKFSHANFQIARKDIEQCEFTANPKWGMGTMPYSGRIILNLRNGRTRELILLGKQDGPDLQSKLAAQPI
jgi:hypothetical protein